MSRVRRRSIRVCSTSGCRCWASATACRRWPTRSAATVVEHRGRRVRQDAVELADGSLLFGELQPEQTAWMSHRDSVVTPPPGFTVTASTDVTPIAAMEDREHGLYAVQFHPEVLHTPGGTDMLRRFVLDACKRPADVDNAGVHRGPGGTNPRSGRRLTGHLRAFGRRRLGRRCAARASGGRRPADVRVRRSRPACARTRPSGWWRRFGDHFHVPLIHVDAADRFLAKARRA